MKLKTKLIFALVLISGTIRAQTNNIFPANGSVGIGTVSPRAILDVASYASNGNISSVLGRLSEGDSTGEGTFLGVRNYISQPTNVKSFAIEHTFYGQTNSSINFYRGTSITGGEIAFNTNSNIEQMRIDAQGNVGIGITTQAEKLSVNGNIRAKEVKVETANWPDYVFKPDYKITSLKDLETYIKTNKHLPEMPTAKEVETDGITVGEMLKLQQKKD